MQANFCPACGQPWHTGLTVCPACHTPLDTERINAEQAPETLAMAQAPSITLPLPLEELLASDDAEEPSPEELVQERRALQLRYQQATNASGRPSGRSTTSILDDLPDLEAPGEVAQQTTQAPPAPLINAPEDEKEDTPAKVPSLPAKRPSKGRRILRRTFLAGGLSIAGLALVGSGLVWLKRPVITVPTDPTRCLFRGHTSIVTAVAWSPDGKRVASASYDGSVQVWDALTGRHVLRYLGHTNTQGGDPVVWSVAWSPDGKQIVSAGNDHTAQVWDAITGKAHFTYSGHSGIVHAVAWSPDGKQIASASYDTTVQVWDAATGKGILAYRGHSREVLTVAWSPDGKQIASSGNDYTAQVWDAATGQTALTYKGHANLGPGVFHGVGALAWSPNGKQIVTGSSDSTAQVWDATTGKTRLTHHQGDGDVLAVAWSPDGRSVASAGSYDGAVQVWSATTGKLLFSYGSHALTTDALSWSPRSGLLASGSFDRTARICQPGPLSS
jgi:WD40 repeat protein/uncharacterized Zn finger protein (UPF0148 family)